MSSDLEKLIAEAGTRFDGDRSPFSTEMRILFFKTHQETRFCHFSGEERDQWPSGFRLAYQALERRQERQREALEKLFVRLEEAEIPFVPIKGADLAFRVYPDSALRPFGDWDIWVRRSDLGGFLALLERDGWRCPLDCCGDHHCGMRSKGEFHVEPHFTLPNFGCIPAKELWTLTEAIPDRPCKRHLSDELNLVMLLRHALAEHGQWTDLLKLLLDVEFLLRRGGVNWEKVAELVRRWRMAHPGLLMAAFPEFFRGRHDPGREFPAEQTAALRNFLLRPGDWNGHLGEMKALTGKPFHPVWLKTQFSRLRRDNLRLRHPEIGRSNTKYLACLVGELVRKTGFFVKGYFRPEKSVQTQLKQEKLIESSWRPEPSGRHRGGDGRRAAETPPFRFAPENGSGKRMEEK